MSLVSFESGLYHWPRGCNEKLSAHFWTSEFDCHCGVCPTQKVSASLIEKLELLRQYLKESLMVHSGYRCSAYQRRLATEGAQTATGTSTHERGEAADIAVRSMGGAGLANTASKYFDAIGVATGWIHVDTRNDKKRRWTYG